MIKSIKSINQALTAGSTSGPVWNNLVMCCRDQNAEFRNLNRVYEHQPATN